MATWPCGSRSTSKIVAGSAAMSAGPPCARSSCAASCSPAPGRSAGGHPDTSSTRPHVRAVIPSIDPPVSASCAVRWRPIRLGRLTVPPAPGIRPSRSSGRAISCRASPPHARRRRAARCRHPCRHRGGGPPRGRRGRPGRGPRSPGGARSAPPPGRGRSRTRRGRHRCRTMGRPRAAPPARLDRAGRRRARRGARRGSSRPSCLPAGGALEGDRHDRAVAVDEDRGPRRARLGAGLDVLTGGRPRPAAMSRPPTR